MGYVDCDGPITDGEQQGRAPLYSWLIVSATPWAVCHAAQQQTVVPLTLSSWLVQTVQSLALIALEATATTDSPGRVFGVHNVSSTVRGSFIQLSRVANQALHSKIVYTLEDVKWSSRYLHSWLLLLCSD